MTTEKKKRTFDETQRLANHLGDVLATIQEKMPYSRFINDKPQTLKAIAITMELIAETPNASVNEATLAAFDQEVDRAIDSVKGWGKSLFSSDESLGLDEIPF